MTADNFATQARDELRTKLIDVIDNRRFDENYPKGLLYKKIEYVIDLLLPTVEAALRQAEKDARIDELTRVSNHLSADSKDRFIDQDVYLWMWEVEYENLNPDQSALHSERQAGTGKE